MRRCGLLSLALLALGCGHPESVVSRVALPKGIERPKGLKPDPEPPAALARPAVEIERSPAPTEPAEVTTVAADAGDGPLVRGACRYDESEASCWRLGGELDPEMTRSVKASLRTNSPSLPLVFGKKNRIVVADVPTGLVASLVPEPNAGGTARSSIPGVGAPGGYVRTLVFVAEEVKTTSTYLTFIEQKRLPRQVPLALRRGATADLEGCRLTVQTIGRLDPASGEGFVLMGRPGWKAVVRASGKRPRDVRFFPVDPFPYAMADGRRVSEKEFSTGKIPAGTTSYRLSPLYSSALPQGAFAAIMDRDPSLVKTILVGADEERRVRLKGIPLDPR